MVRRILPAVVAEATEVGARRCPQCQQPFDVLDYAAHRLEEQVAQTARNAAASRERRPEARR